jgi:hypothetical protein
MSDSDFSTVYDAASIGYREWWFPAFGLIFVVIGLILPRLFKAGVFPDYQKRMFAGWFPKVFVGFSVFWTLSAFLITFGAYWSGRETLLSGKAQYVEGNVQHFIPMPYQGHADESFDVSGVSFHYSDFQVGGGFNNTSSHGGPIRDGLFVRIWYSGNNILKLQVPKGS